MNPVLPKKKITLANDFYSNPPGIPAVAAHPLTSLAGAERLATAAGSTLLLPASTQRLLPVPMATSQHLAHTRAAASLRHLHPTPLRRQVVTMARGMIRRCHLCITCFLGVQGHGQAGCFELILRWFRKR